MSPHKKRLIVWGSGDLLAALPQVLWSELSGHGAHGDHSRSRRRDGQREQVKNMMWKTCSHALWALWQRKWRPAAFRETTLPESPWQHKLHSLASEWGRRGGQFNEVMEQKKILYMSTTEIQCRPILNSYLSYSHSKLISFYCQCTWFYLAIHRGQNNSVPFYSIVGRNVQFT